MTLSPHMDPVDATRRGTAIRGLWRRLTVCFWLAITWGMTSTWGPVRAAVLVQHSFTNINVIVPDDDPSGVADVRTLRGSPAGSVVVDVNVWVKLSGSGARNGDLYVTLEHQSGYAVLMNRVGRTLPNPFGYEDQGLDVTLDDEATNGDVHLYRATLFGNHQTPVGQPLASWWSGNWAPDGRDVDPDLVNDTSAREASLGSMKGLPVDGRWRLFVADVLRGGVVRLDSWGLEIRSTTDPAEFDLELRNATIRTDAESRVVTVPTSIQGRVNVEGAGDTKFEAAVTGAGLLRKQGDGLMLLAGANTFSGGIQMEEGTLVLGSDLATGLGPLSLKGGTLAAQGASRRVDNAVQLAGPLRLGKGESIDLAGSVTLSGLNALEVQNNTEISGEIEGGEPGAGFIKRGDGKLTLSGINTFGGGVQLDEGTLVIGNDQALGTGKLTLGGGRIEVAGGRRTIANDIEISNDIEFGGGASLTLLGGVNLRNTPTLAIEDTLTLGGSVIEGAKGSGIVKRGNGTLILEGANTFSGGVDIEEGTLVVANLSGSATGSGDIRLSGRGTLAGGGTVLGKVRLGSGSTISPGYSPGTLTTGGQTWEGGAGWILEMNNAEETLTSGPGWDRLRMTGPLVVNATASNPFTIRLISLDRGNRPGSVANFDPARSYLWRIAEASEDLTSLNVNALRLDPQGFSNPTQGGRFELRTLGSGLFLAFTPQRVTTPARILSIARVTGTTIRLRIEGEPAGTYRVESTRSLLPPDWQPLSAVRMSADGTAEFLDSEPAEAAARFYRFVAP